MAKLNSGTRIYGTANVDTILYVGSNSVINATGVYTTGTVNASSHTIGSIYIANTTQSTFNSNSVFNANVTIGSNGDLILSGNVGIYANGTFGTNNQVLTSNGNGVYWANATASGGGSFSNGQSISVANIVVTGSFTANSSTGTAGQVLTSNGTNIYWANATASGGGSFSNGQSISVANLAITGSLTAANSVGTTGQALISTGTGVQWGALSPGYNYSSQFAGNASSYLSIPTNTAFAFPGDFTIECWANVSDAGRSYDAGKYGNFVSNGIAATLGNSYNFAFGISGGVINLVNFASDGTNRISISSLSISLNAWHHFAVVRSGSTITLYVDGASIGTATYATAITSSGTVQIGRSAYADVYENWTKGFISNVRIVKGTAVYTSNFTVPTSPLSAISGTSLLTCNSITPSDSSSNLFQVTTNGTVTTTATLSPFTSTTVSIPTQSLTAVRQQFTGDGSTTQFNVAGGYTSGAISVFVNGVLVRNGSDVTVTSGSFITFTGITPPNGSLIDVTGTVPTTYSSITPVSYSTSFNGSSQYLTLASNAALAFGTGDFTIECWVNSSNWKTSTAAPIFISAVTGGMFFGTNGTNFVVRAYSVADQLATATLPALNTWTHVAAVRIGTTLSLYYNGALITSTTNSYNFLQGAVYIGNDAATAYYQGYISNLRITKGVGVYTGAFTPPQSPLQATQIYGGPTIQAITGTQTSLLTCNGPTIIDGSTNAFTITNNGSAPVSTAIVPTFTNVTINNPVAFYQAAYLVVAGGGGGGYGTLSGGGGAGGIITGSTLLTPGTTYTVTVGGGGSGSSSPTNGANSSISGLIVGAITAIGGGKGSGASAASSGGSGGGGDYNSFTTAASGTSNPAGAQGNAGGNGSVTGNKYGGGGGGGASSSGGNAITSSNGVGGVGGTGFLTTITGSSLYFGGGGGGCGGADTSFGSSIGGAGGIGGGGGGGVYNNSSIANTPGVGGGSSLNSGASGSVNIGGAGGTNSGGGGGGGSTTSSGYGGAGGSGVVILSVPTANYTGTKTGSPTVTTNGIYTVLTFTASGTYTA